MMETLIQKRSSERFHHPKHDSAGSMTQIIMISDDDASLVSLPGTVHSAGSPPAVDSESAGELVPEPFSGLAHVLVTRSSTRPPTGTHDSEEAAAPVALAAVAGDAGAAAVTVAPVAAPGPAVVRGPKPHLPDTPLPGPGPMLGRPTALSAWLARALPPGLSMVPKRARPASAAARTAGTLSSSHRSFRVIPGWDQTRLVPAFRPAGRFWQSAPPFRTRAV